MAGSKKIFNSGFISFVHIVMDTFKSFTFVA